MADALVAQNKIDYKHDKEPIPHDNPLLVKYFYVAGGGVKRSRLQSEEKELEGAAMIKKAKDLQEAGLFSQALGSASGAAAKSESVELDALRKGEEALRPEPLRSSLKGVIGKPTSNLNIRILSQR